MNNEGIKKKEVKSNKIFIFIIILLLCVVGFLGYTVYTLSGTVTDLKNDKEVKDTDNPNKGENANTGVSDDETGMEYSTVTKDQDSSYGEYQALIISTKNSTVYKATKTTAADLSDEQKLLGTIVYLLKYNTSYKNKTSLDANEVKAFAEKWYDCKINTLPKTLTAKHSQVTDDFTLKDGKYVMNEVYEGVYSYYESDTLFVDKIGSNVNTGTFVIYEKVIINEELGNSGCGEISNLDKTKKTTVSSPDGEVGSCATGRELYALYPEYYSTIKHTFRQYNEDTIYVSSEIVD